MDRTKYLKNAKRVVVKVGTSLLLAQDRKKEREYFDKMLAAINELRGRGIQVFLVSSGAIGMGMRALGIKKRPQDISKQQALAAVGQNRLMVAYQEAGEKYLIQVSQVLLTYDDIINRKRFTNAQKALERLLQYGALPVINENDTVSIDEVRAGDNDRLSALVANMVRADALIILSDVEGYQERGASGAVKVVPWVEKVDGKLRRMARGKGSETATGGMSAKIEAMQIATLGGVASVIAAGKDPAVLVRVIDGEKTGTFFKPGKRVEGRKHWIAYALSARGEIGVDDGARRAMLDGGKSLLPSGVARVSGQFGERDAVSVLDSDEKEIARGLVKYGANELRKIMGKKTSEIAAVLGSKRSDEVIHRDDLFVLGK